MKVTYENIFTGSMLLLVFSLAFVFPYVPVLDQRIPPTDFIFPVVFAVWAGGILLKKRKLKFHKFYFLLAFYLFALFVSAIFSADPRASFIKFAGEVYLVFLCVITFNFVTDLKAAGKLVLAWLSGTIFVLLVVFFSIGLFYFDPGNELLGFFVNHYGTVPAGNYPRVKATFFHSNLLCNYLSVSLLLAIGAGKIGWIDRTFSKFLVFSILLAALFTFSPGLGGIALSLGAAIWLFNKTKRPFFSKASLIGGIFVSVLFLGLIVFAMRNHPTAPFVIDLPLTEKQLYPSSRVMVWTATFGTFANNFWNGVGLGEDVCRVRYLNPTGILEDLRDGHNTILNVAAQAGILGLISIIAIFVFLFGKIFALKDPVTNSDVFYDCCALAILSAFIYQGLSGSFEETRHLWVLFGFFLSADKPADEDR